MSSVIHFENVSKKYFIGVGGRSLRSVLAQIPNRILNRRVPDREELWALKDVTFNVNRGESLGILGHNGAGKTTVLKLLSDITKPTSGSIQVNGRLGTLIELGAGFHPELTGRENVYLNGVILGLTRKEVAKAFDSIIEFAGIKKFIDTPVKRYSSGMYVRLAFAVAAHVNPSILLVDEVLAVGDLAFRAKCYRRMAELRAQGTTVVLVSHDVYAIRDTCDRALLLWQGGLIEDGPSEDVISTYIDLMQEHKTGLIGRNPAQVVVDHDENGSHPSARKLCIEEVLINNDSQNDRVEIVSGNPLTIEIHFDAFELVEDPIFRIDLYHEGRIYSGYSTKYDSSVLPSLKGTGCMTFHIEHLHLPTGIYSTSIVVSETYEHNLLDVHHQAYPIQVNRAQDSRGEVALPHTWRINGKE